MMNDLPRKTLREILVKHGKEIAGNAERCRGLLNDLCGDYRREINVLVTAVEEHVPLDLLAAAQSMPTNLLLTRLEKKLGEQTGLTAQAARWAVGSWALALDVATDAQIAERESKSGHHSAGEAAQSEATANSKSANEPRAESVADNRSPQTQTRRPPADIPAASFPPIHLPVKDPSAAKTGGAISPSVSNTRSRLFRGCLIFVFMLIVSFVALLFGVPFAVEKMRETQQERQNEAPRFPDR